jgi:hypothetical protein
LIAGGSALISLAVHLAIPRGERGSSLGKRLLVTCDDCFFRKTSLCALRLGSPCETFRHAEHGVLAPPRQPRLVVRPVSAFAREIATA